MQNNKMIQIKNIKLSKEKNSLFLVNEHGQAHIDGVNFIKHALEIPYTRKDGTLVTKEDILRMKERKFVSPNGQRQFSNTLKRAY